MKMHVKRGAIITIKMRNGYCHTGKVLAVSDYELVLMPQAFVYKENARRDGFIRYADVEDIMVDNLQETEHHFDKDEIIYWKYFTIERWKNNCGPSNVYPYITCLRNNYQMSKNDNDNPMFYLCYGEGDFLE